MCGIYGHIKKNGEENSVLVCLEGLRQLEYRGYDSAGIAGIVAGNIVSYKAVGKVSHLDAVVQASPRELDIAIAHTRWATHGGVTTENAHPHFDQNLNVALVHNGIVENYLSLRTFLEKKGIQFSSDTDTEVITQLIAYYYQGDFVKSVRKALSFIEGSFAIACIHKDYPDTILAAVHARPLIIGICHKTGDVFLSSDTNAFMGRSLDIFYLHDDEIAAISRERTEVYNKKGRKLTKITERMALENQKISKEGFDHFLLKEIYEQPTTIRRTLSGRIDSNKELPIFEELTVTDDFLKGISQIKILACGSSYHAGYIAKHLFEAYAKISTHVEIASEARYADFITTKETLVIAISQSGETADTIAALQNGKRNGATTISICNVERSSLSRESDSTLLLHAGPEISVCSTKAFTSQLTLLSLFAIKLGYLKGLPKSKVKQLLSELALLPSAVEKVLLLDSQIQRHSEKYAGYSDFFFIGRKHMFATALESSLKLKEISYLNANGYPAGEMKHGHIALISKNFPTIAFCGNSETLDKLLSNLMEIKARGGPILAFAPLSAQEIETIADDTLYLPETPDWLAPIPYAVAGQLFAYHIAKIHGTDIDQPRNLAKSVTVE